MTTTNDDDNNATAVAPPPPPLGLGELGIGLMQWGTTSIDNKVVNPKGNLSDTEVQQIWKTCRRNHKIVFFDTAEGYGGGTSESRIRNVQNWYNHEEQQKGSNDDDHQIIIATKFLPTLWRWTKGAFYKSLKGSLERLGVECIDLYFIHTPIHPLPIEIFIQWSCDAIDDGLIKEIGISNCNSALVMRAHNVAKRNNKRIACNQIMLNMLVWQSPEHQRTVKLCHELGIAIAAYSPIGQGLLTDFLTIDKFSSIRAVKMTGVQYTQIQPLREEILRICQQNQLPDSGSKMEVNVTMAQVAINWVRSHGAVPLIGCRSVTQVEDAIQSLHWNLTPEEVLRLDELCLGLSLFERPFYRRCLFVVFISVLQLAYYTEQRYKYLRRKLLELFGLSSSSDHASENFKED